MLRIFTVFFCFLLCFVNCREVISSEKYIIAMEKAVLGVQKADEPMNNSPIIGILAQEISWHLNKKWPDTYTSYIAASYVKFVEGAGGRAVPIWIGRPREYYERMLSKVNGILLPGGGTWFNQTKGYAVAGSHIYDIAREMNDNGIYMPIFGTCLGFELLLYVSNHNQEYRITCSSQRQSLPLMFTEDYQKSKLFGSASDDVIEILANEPVTSNFHSFCLTRQNVSAFNLSEEWDILSYNDDFNGLEFVSSIEHKKYPFYGVQFHPEKNIYEWIRNRNISHTANAIKANQHFANFFVDETRKNLNRFETLDEENGVLIYNFPVTFTGLVKSAFEQSYLFTDTVEYGKNIHPYHSDKDYIRTIRHKSG